MTKSPDIKVSICAIFRDEARYLREWIEFHRLVGVGKFYLYNNRSGDNYLEVLQPYIDDGTVDLTEWPFRYDGCQCCRAQVEAYQHCFTKLKGTDQFLAMMDIDEFLFSPKFSTITEAIATLPVDHSSIGVSWVLFGSSDKQVYEDIPVIERFTWRPHLETKYAGWIKSLLNMKDPSTALGSSGHLFSTQNGTYNTDGKLLTEPQQPPVIDLLRINHYFTKSREEWEFRHPDNNRDDKLQREEDRWSTVQGKDVEDKTIQSYLPALKKKLSEKVAGISISKAAKIQGWMSEKDLTYLATVASKTTLGNIVEIGSWVGRSTYAIASNTDSMVFAVDTWKGSDEQVHRDLLAGKPGSWLFDTFVFNVKGVSNVWPVPVDSKQAAKLMRMAGFEFDLIFIDASHEYDNVKADIETWLPLLSDGGIICGHDYADWGPGVIQAVNELIPKFRVIDAIWTTEE